MLIAMGAAYGAHSLLREYSSVLQGVPDLSEYAAVAYLALPIWLLITALTGADRIVDRKWTRLDVLFSITRVHVLGLIGLTLALFVTRSILNRSLVALFLVSSFAFMTCERLLILGWLSRHRTSGFGTKRVLVVGDPSPALDQFVTRATSAELPITILGRIGTSADDEALTGASRALRYLGAPELLGDVLQREAIDEVVFFRPFDEPRRMIAELDACETVGVPASFALDRETLRRAAPEVRSAFGQSFMSFEVATKAPVDLGFKHTVDVVLAFLGIVALSPLLIAVAFVVLVKMGRPVLFAQQRAGLRGRPFPLLKFRTMVRDAEARKKDLEAANEMSGPVFKIAADPRVTPLGRFLRKTSIDELPQLFNVLTGTMSLVGPRPLPVKEQEAIVGWHRRRLSMKPGITCLWQIRGRSDVDFEQWMAYDLEYIDTWSFSLDLKILLLTIPVVLKGRGAK